MKWWHQFTRREEEEATSYEIIKDVLIDSTFGGLLFYMGLSSGQAVQHMLSLSASNRVFSTPLGASIVMGSSILAVSCAPWPRQKYLGKEFTAEITEPMHYVMTALSGTLIFFLLGGRFYRIAPSDYRYLGAFQHEKASLPANIEYATTSERAVLNSYGKLFGCHTCGTKHTSFHADHMPPVKYDTIWLSNIDILKLFILMFSRFVQKANASL